MLREQDQKFEEAKVDDAAKNIVNSTRYASEFPGSYKIYFLREEDELNMGDGPSGDESCGKVGLLLNLNESFKCCSF